MVSNLTIRLFWMVAILLLLTGPVVGVVVKRHIEADERERAREVFADQLAKQVFLLEKQIGVFVEALGGLKSFFESSDFVTRAEFSHFSRFSLSRYPAIRALEWAPRIPDDLRLIHEDRARTAGLHDYCLTARSADGTWMAAPDRDEYYPVFYVEPLAGNAEALGFDLISEPIRRRAVLAAIDRSDVVLSDPLQLGQGSERRTGILMMARIDRSSPPEQLADGCCEGLVVLVLDLDELIRSTLLADAYLDASNYCFELSDLDAGGRSVSICAHGGDDEESAGDDWEIESMVTAGGQTWSLKARPLASFLAEHMPVDPVSAGVSAAAAWELVWILLIALANWARVSGINRHRRILDSVLLSMSEGVVVADTEGKVILTNHAAMLLLGYDDELHDNGLDALVSLCRRPGAKEPVPRERFPLVAAINGEQVRDTVLWVPPANTAAHGTWVSANASPLMSPDGEQHGGVLVLRDITEKKQSIEFSKRMNNAVEETDDSVFITDNRGVIQYVNAAFERTTGYMRDEVLGQTPSVLKSGRNPPGHYEELWSTILRGEVFRRMIINRKKTGEVYYADQTITPMRDLGGQITHFVAVCKDMTEYRLLRQREVEMEIAVEVQQRLLPLDAPTLPHLDVAGTVLSADATCGDYFDIIPLPGDRVCLTVGDVSGHGIGPALVMAETRAYVRSLEPENNCPHEILASVNRHLLRDLEGSHFVTLLMACVDPRGGCLTYASAGHDSCFVLDADGAVKAELGSTGLPLGMFEEAEYVTNGNVALVEGDILVLITDGLADCLAHRDSFLDVQDCLAVVHRHRAEPARAIIGKVDEHVQGFLDGEAQNDDITVVICKVTG